MSLNVREDLFRQRIDGRLTPDLLGEIVTRALNRRSAVRSARILTGGCLNRVLALELESQPEELVLKISPEVGDRSLEREGKVLDCFRRSSRLAVPEPYLVDVSGELLPGSFLVMSLLPGRVMHEAVGSLNATQRNRILRQITSDVVELHTRTAVGFGGVEQSVAERSDWPSFWIPRFQRVLERVQASGVVPPRFLEEARRVSEHFPRLLDVGSRSTMTHYDIWSGNVLVTADAAGARVSGYIDIPGFYADYARELSFMEMFGIADARFYATYRESHPMDDGWEIRKNIYNLKMHLTHVTMYPQEAYYRQGAAACLDFIRRRV